MNINKNNSKKIIEKIINDLTILYDDECSSIILYGSSAIKQCVYKWDNGKINFFSDIEFLVVPRKPEYAYNKEFRKNLINKSNEYLKNNKIIGTPPFVDVFPVSIEYFKNAQLRISSFEIKNNAVILKGENLLELIPNIDDKNYDKRIQNIEIVKGLKILLLEFRKWFFENDEFSCENPNKISYFLSSNYLNILRTLLPFFGIFRSKLNERIEVLDILLNYKLFKKYFTNDDIDLFKKIAFEKQNITFSIPPEKLFIITLEGYEKLIKLLLDKKNINEKNIIKNKDSLFFGNNIKKFELCYLMNFFLVSLNNIKKIIIRGKLSDRNIKKSKTLFDKLCGGKNFVELNSTILNYEYLEKTRWKIIGSKD